MRERMVTRTVASVDYVCMTVNTQTRQVEDLTVNIPNGTTMTEKARLKANAEALPANNTLVQIISETVKETLYGMSEEQFIKLAKVLPPRTKPHERRRRNLSLSGKHHRNGRRVYGYNP